MLLSMLSASIKYDCVIRCRHWMHLKRSAIIYEVAKLIINCISLSFLLTTK